MSEDVHRQAATVPAALSKTERPGSVARGVRQTGLRLGSVLGIEIRLDISVLIVFTLVVYSLGAGLFPRWHPDWEPSLNWGTAVAAGFLFFASLLAHELSHSLVAKLRGIPVPRITLFIFGGVSELEREPNTPGTEFLIAIVGPAMSFALGIFFTWLGASMAGPEFTNDVTQDAQGAIAALGPLPTLFFWLGPINLMLAVFNLVPGFPLDGGRVLRAFLWGITGDLLRATRWASVCGRLFAWILMGWGVLGLFGGALGGLWLILIGWFLNNAARQSYAQLLVQHALEDLVVRNLMTTRFDVVRPDVGLEEFIHDRLLRSGQLVWPVVEDQQLVGLIAFDEVSAVSEDNRSHLTVGEVMSTIEESLSPEDGGRQALQALVKSQKDPLPVVEGGHVVGLLHRGDIMRWLALHHLEPDR